jgi:membrane protein DedA with SNARE-associated domain
MQMMEPRDRRAMPLVGALMFAVICFAATYALTAPSNSNHDIQGMELSLLAGAVGLGLGLVVAWIARRRL